MGRWYCCNDAHVSLSSTQEVLSEKVYILFYLRNNQSPRSSKTGAPCNTKAADSGVFSPLPKPAELSKLPIYKPNGISSPKNDVLTILKNGKISSNLQIKSLNYKNPEMKNAIANGNGNSKVQYNGSIEKNGDTKLSPAVKKNTSHSNGSMEMLKVENKADLSSTSKSSAIYESLSDVVENGRKQFLQGPNGNGNSNLLKIATHKESAAQNLTLVDGHLDYDHQSSNVLNDNDSVTTAPKRKTRDTEKDEDLDACAKESSSFSGNDASGKNQTTCQQNCSQKLESFKEL